MTDTAQSDKVNVEVLCLRHTEGISGKKIVACRRLDNGQPFNPMHDKHTRSMSPGYVYTVDTVPDSVEYWPSSIRFARAHDDTLERRTLQLAADERAMEAAAERAERKAPTLRADIANIMVPIRRLRANCNSWADRDALRRLVLEAFDIPLG